MRGFKAILNKSGSSVIMVLLAMAFISILGTILMFIAYTGYQIKAAEAKGERAFYSAEAALDEVRADIQQLVSDCIAAAYTNMLVLYTHQDGQLEETFRKNFAIEFKKELTEDIDGFNYNGNIAECRAHNAQVCKWEDDDCEFIIRGVTVTHRSDDGFVSRITSDIVVIIPDFSYVRADYPVNELALIAANELNIPAVGVSINDGISYAGRVNVNTGIHAFTINNGALISGGDIIEDSGIININGNFIVNNNSSVWAKRIIVGEDNSSAELRGEAYIEDDLVLNGAGARALLSGRYFGFGNSLTDAARSSSIIVNGLNSRLHMSGLDTLFLGGQSFIDTGSGYDDILTGHSVSVKSDQLAYLVPQSIIGMQSNPIIFYNVDPPNTAGLENYHLVYRPITATGQTLLFVFMKFDNRDDANEYFRVYFDENKDEIENYVNQYLYLYQPPVNAKASAVYYTLDMNGLNIEVPPPAQDLSDVSDRLTDMFENITRSLSSSIKVNENISPFDYIVDTEKVNDLAFGTYEFFEGDTVRAVIIKCDGSEPANTNSFPDSVNLILSTGDVDVGMSGFKGLILSAGTVTLNGSVTAAPAEIIPSIRARSSGGQMFGEFLNNPPRDDEHETTTPSWDMSALVFYENWHKR
ncbi:MAG: hypothetical protein FWD48_10950 [Oscillospiraceae bacterium]|nr:hypothetical protein [Oscillospiraceae bacterium]